MGNVHFIHTFSLFAAFFSSSLGCGLYGLRMCAEQPACLGSTARSGVTKKGT